MAFVVAGLAELTARGLLGTVFGERTVELPARAARIAASTKSVGDGPGWATALPTGAMAGTAVDPPALAVDEFAGDSIVGCGETVE